MVKNEWVWGFSSRTESLVIIESTDKHWVTAEGSLEASETCEAARIELFPREAAAKLDLQHRQPGKLQKKMMTTDTKSLEVDMLCPLSESPSRKREDLHDNATRKGREIFCWLEPGPLLQPTQWCKVREPRAPVSTHIYRVLDLKHKQWVVGASRLVTCLQSNFIGTNFGTHGTFQGTFSEVYWARTD